MKRKPDPHLQKFRSLKRDPVNAGKELQELWLMAGLELPSTHIPWSDGKAAPAPARIRNDPRTLSGAGPIDIDVEMRKQPDDRAPGTFLKLLDEAFKFEAEQEK